MSAVQEMKVQFLIQEDRLEKEMATHSIILAWEIPWTEEPGSPWGSKGVRHTLAIEQQQSPVGGRAAETET